MTAPALPPLPPEVEDAICVAMRAATDFGVDGRLSDLQKSQDAVVALRTAIRAALDKRGEVSAASAASARALGGDGEPVRWAVARSDGTLNGPCHDDADYAAGRVAWLNASDEAFLRQFKPYRVIPLYTRPAATGDTTDDAVRAAHRAEVERAVREAVEQEREACAKACDEQGGDITDDEHEGYDAEWWDGYEGGTEDCAAAIRARGEATS